MVLFRAGRGRVLPGEKVPREWLGGGAALERLETRKVSRVLPPSGRRRVRRWRTSRETPGSESAVTVGAMS